MFKKNTSNPEFPTIIFFDTVNDKFISKIVDTDAVLLNQIIDKIKSGNDENMDDGILAAKKMAVFYGVPGLLQFVNLNILIMSYEKSQGEEVQQQAFNTYVYLQLAERLYKNDPEKFDDLMAALLPDENVKSVDFWRAKKDKLMELGHFEDFVDEAIEEGDRMFRECKPSDARINMK